MTRHLYAVQDATGREICAWTGDVAKVSEVTAEVDGTTVTLRRGDDVLADGQALDDAELTLHRWGRDKLADPVSKPLRPRTAKGKARS